MIPSGCDDVEVSLQFNTAATTKMLADSEPMSEPRINPPAAVISGLSARGARPFDIQQHRRSVDRQPQACRLATGVR